MHSIINRQPTKFDVLDLFDDIGRDKEYVLGDAKDEAAFVDVIAKALSANKTPTMIYDRRIEAMFGYMAYFGLSRKHGIELQIVDLLVIKG